MITKFLVSHDCVASIVLFGLVSLLVQMMMVLSLNSYVRASANMKTTKKKIFINLRNQFETIYGMDYQVRNVSAYVEKYLLKLKFMGLSFAAWEKVPFLVSGIVTLIAGGEAFYLYIKGHEPSVLVEILFAYGITLACFFVFFHIFGVKNKRAQIQIQLVDYLENYLANRLLRSRNGEKELRVLNEDMEEALLDGAAGKPEDLQNGTGVAMAEQPEDLQNGTGVAMAEQPEDLSDGTGVAMAEQPEDLSDGMMDGRQGDLTDRTAVPEEDMDMLRRLVIQLAENREQSVSDSEYAQGHSPELETAGSLEDTEDSDLGDVDMHETDAGDVGLEDSIDLDDPNYELLEEFVQSFLA